MGKKSKKRVTLRILLIFFIILAFTGIGLLRADLYKTDRRTEEK